jgi:hypothetical protein
MMPFAFGDGVLLLGAEMICFIQHDCQVLPTFAAVKSRKVVRPSGLEAEGNHRTTERPV